MADCVLGGRELIVPAIRVRVEMKSQAGVLQSIRNDPSHRDIFDQIAVFNLPGVAAPPQDIGILDNDLLVFTTVIIVWVWWASVLEDEETS